MYSWVRCWLMKSQPLGLFRAWTKLARPRAAKMGAASDHWRPRRGRDQQVGGADHEGDAWQGDEEHLREGPQIGGAGSGRGRGASWARTGSITLDIGLLIC